LSVGELYRRLVDALPPLELEYYQAIKDLLLMAKDEFPKLHDYRTTWDFVRWFEKWHGASPSWSSIETKNPEKIREQVIKDLGEALEMLNTGSKKIRVVNKQLEEVTE